MPHDHRFEFTRDPDALADAARRLDWPDDAPERIEQVQRCECGALQRVAWIGGPEREIPPWMVPRLIEMVRERQREQEPPGGASR